MKYETSSSLDDINEQRTDYSVNSRIVRQLKSLSATEREKFIEILHRLLELDDQLANLHLCLPTVAIVFYLLDGVPLKSVTLNPAALLSRLEDSEPKKVRPR